MKNYTKIIGWNPNCCHLLRWLASSNEKWNSIILTSLLNGKEVRQTQSQTFRTLCPRERTKFAISIYVMCVFMCSHFSNFNLKRSIRYCWSNFSSWPLLLNEYPGRIFYSLVNHANGCVYPFECVCAALCCGCLCPCAYNLQCSMLKCQVVSPLQCRHFDNFRSL